MNTNVTNVTVILSIIVGTYFIATALFHWSFAKHFNCPARLLALKHTETLPYVLVLMLFFGVASWGEVIGNSEREFGESFMINFCLMLISWILFFRAWFDFKRLSVWMFLPILLGVSLVALVLWLPGDIGWSTRVGGIADDRVAMSDKLLDSIVRTTKSANELAALAKEKMEPLPSNIPIFLPKWGDGTEKDLLEIYNWSRKEEKRWLEYYPRMGMAIIAIYLFLLLVWVIPMSVIAGRLFALPGVRKYETVEFVRNRVEECRYLVSALVTG